MIIILVKDDWFDHSRTRQTCVCVCAYKAVVYRHTLDINSWKVTKWHTYAVKQRIAGSLLAPSGFLCMAEDSSLLVEECIATVIYIHMTPEQRMAFWLYIHLFIIMLSDIQRCIDQVEYIIGRRVKSTLEVTDWENFTKHIQIMISHQNQHKLYYSNGI